mmetsp:Transcript_9392/g.23408  ORF Transcript_9392/g.23408 Transcript_9392/m.23408 type:complete len:273 (+) Transcript_9392:110-928(+)
MGPSGPEHRNSRGCLSRRDLAPKERRPLCQSRARFFRIMLRGQATPLSEESATQRHAHPSNRYLPTRNPRPIRIWNAVQGRTALRHGLAHPGDERQGICGVCPRSTGPRVFRGPSILHPPWGLENQPRRSRSICTARCRRTPRGYSALSEWRFLRSMLGIPRLSYVADRAPGEGTQGIFGLFAELPRDRWGCTVVAHYVLFAIHFSTFVSNLDTFFHAPPHLRRSHMERRRAKSILPGRSTRSVEGRSSILFGNCGGTFECAGVCPKLVHSL